MLHKLLHCCAVPCCSADADADAANADADADVFLVMLIFSQLPGPDDLAQVSKAVAR